MNEVVHADIFFVITSVAVIAVTILLCIGIFYAIKTLRSVQRIVERIEKESDAIVGDVAQVRKYLTQGNLITKIIGSMFGKRTATKRRRTAKRKAEPEEDTVTNET